MANIRWLPKRGVENALQVRHGNHISNKTVRGINGTSLSCCQQCGTIAYVVAGLVRRLSHHTTPHHTPHTTRLGHSITADRPRQIHAFSNPRLCPLRRLRCIERWMFPLTGIPAPRGRAKVIKTILHQSNLHRVGWIQEMGQSPSRGIQVVHYVVRK